MCPYVLKYSITYNISAMHSLIVHGCGIPMGPRVTKLDIYLESYASEACENESITIILNCLMKVRNFYGKNHKIHQYFFSQDNRPKAFVLHSSN